MAGYYLSLRKLLSGNDTFFQNTVFCLFIFVIIILNSVSGASFIIINIVIIEIMHTGIAILLENI